MTVRRSVYAPAVDHLSLEEAELLAEMRPLSGVPSVLSDEVELDGDGPVAEEAFDHFLAMMDERSWL